MEINEVRISKDKDFEHFHSLVNNDDGWNNSYSKNNLVVKTRWTEESRVKLIKVTFIFCWFLLVFMYYNIRLAVPVSLSVFQRV